MCSLTQPLACRQFGADCGVIEVFDRPSEFRYRYWCDNHGTQRLPENQITIRYLLTGNDCGTRLMLEHGNLLTAERQMMMTSVWDYLLAQLKAYVEHL